MLTIARLKLRSWKCFEAVDLVLAPTDYAIVARRVDDPESSNWAGKSSLVEAVDFVLHGRLSRAVRGKSGWITEGAKSGECELVLSDGTRIVRSKGVRGPEKVWCFEEGSPQGAMGDEAERRIGELVGLTKEDFLATCYFQQRQMARLVLCEPSTRMDLVAGWIRLGPLQECEDMAGAVLAELTKKRDALLDQARYADAAVGQHLAENWPEEAQAEAVLVEQERVLSIARAAREEAIERATLAAQGRRYEAVVAEGKRLRDQCEQVRPAVALQTLDSYKQALRELGEQLGVAERDAGALRKIAEGRFDGVCPIVGQTCPAREFVVSTVNRDRQRGEGNSREVSELRSKYEEIGKAQAELTQVLRTHEHAQVRLGDLREEARRLKPAYEQWKQTGEADARVMEEVFGRLEQEVADTRAALQTLRNEKARAEAKRKEAEQARQQAAALEPAIQTAREGLAIFGKNGAQRRAAEGALGEIEQGANAALEGCGIELAVQMVWSREGSGLAPSCGQCGAAYPASARVKSCERCGAERGPNLVNRLEVEMSDRSGGAEDLAGGVVQLAASRWLREDRASRWATAMLDEPFGALDTANRRTFAAHLPVLLRGAGFAQSFVIAHHSNVLDALPGRIEIVSDGRRSTARVVG